MKLALAILSLMALTSHLAVSANPIDPNCCNLPSFNLTLVIRFDGNKANIDITPCDNGTHVPVKPPKKPTTVKPVDEDGPVTDAPEMDVVINTAVPTYKSISHGTRKPKPRPTRNPNLKKTTKHSDASRWGKNKAV